jgi:acetoin:2,6-dichlorophenolindophenol oxidoreductase subunit beta
MIKTISYREALNLAMTQEMERDSSVFTYGLDVSDHKRIFGSTVGLVEKFGPDRCFATPLAEDAMTGFALGSAINGMRPIHIHIRVDFLMLAMNQIVNMISNFRYITGGQLKIPIVIRAIIGRGWGQSAQHSKSLHSFFAHVPGLKVIMPTTPFDAKGLLASAIRDDNPVICLEHRWLYDIVDKVDVTPENLVPLGEPNVLQEGTDLTIVATSWMNVEALRAADIMNKFHGKRIEVIDPRTIAPLDYEIIYESVNKTRHCIVADYDWINCGFSAEVASRVSEFCFDKLKSPVARLGFSATPCPTSRPLENKFYPNTIDIVRQVENKLNLKSADLTKEEFYSYENKFKGPF